MRTTFPCADRPAEASVLPRRRFRKSCAPADPSKMPRTALGRSVQRRPDNRNQSRARGAAARKPRPRLLAFRVPEVALIDVPETWKLGKRLFLPPAERYCAFRVGVPLVIWIGSWGCFERVPGLGVLGLDSRKRLCCAARHGQDCTRSSGRLCGVVGDPCAVVGAPGLGPLAAFGCALRALGLAGRQRPSEGYCRAFAASQACGRRSDPASCYAACGPGEPSAQRCGAGGAGGGLVGLGGVFGSSVGRCFRFRYRLRRARSVSFCTRFWSGSTISGCRRRWRRASGTLRGTVGAGSWAAR